MAPSRSNTNTTRYDEDGKPLPTRNEFYRRLTGSSLSTDQIQKSVDHQMNAGGFQDPLPEGDYPFSSSAAPAPPPVRKATNPVPVRKASGAKPAPAFPNIPPAPKPAPVPEEKAAVPTPKAQMDHYAKQFTGLPRGRFTACVAAEAARIRKAGGWEAVKDDEAFLGAAKRVLPWMEDEDEE
ncbi:hypothetical protein HYALB_00007468 [Hymenoscyphus albidus]|uniref:Uncharacterized protein n=1 Tax=Hymenoscyphus albidus TaxID=595503 RepID=A0A9N9LEL8_9HELO|nr:hypothetical protein HYALB_00007468 [Hymenoscyphus albidus]